MMVAFSTLVGAGADLIGSGFVGVGSEENGDSSITEAPVLSGTGNFLVDSEMPAGTYRAEDPGPGCNWSLYSGGLATDQGEGAGDAEVTIAAHHTLFKTSGCGTWKRVDR